MIIMMFKSIHGLVPDYICDEITMQRDIRPTVRTTNSTVNNMCHILYLNGVKMHLPIEARFYGMRFQKIFKKCETLNGFKQCVKLHVVE